MRGSSQLYGSSFFYFIKFIGPIYENIVNNSGAHHQIEMCMIRARTRDDLFLTLRFASTLPHLLKYRT